MRNEERVLVNIRGERANTGLMQCAISNEK